MIWWVSAIILTIMMGALQVVPTSIDLDTIDTAYFSFKIVRMGQWGLLIGAALLVAIITHLSRLKSSAPLSKTGLLNNTSSALPIKSTATLRARAYRVAWPLMKAVIISSLVMISLVMVVAAEYQAQLQGPPAPIRVQALVTVKGLSDSLGDLTGSSYRQVAVLTEIQALGQGKGPSRHGNPTASQNSLSINNPWLSDSQDHTATHSLEHHLNLPITYDKDKLGQSTRDDESLTVLLAAFVKPTEDNLLDKKTV
ncbi:MAG: hypothetical protein Q4P13_04620, partial [Psychrobacter sp.]|nr:hypothetical protein [Psychrobacter sp.]